MKKRVHEVARQLKEYGVELSNQELVERLLALGYDVKSHSSSLEFDEADAVIRTIVSERSSAVRAPARPRPATSYRDGAASSTAPANQSRREQSARPVSVSPPPSARDSVDSGATPDGADHAPSLSAAMTVTRLSIGRFLQLRMQAAFGKNWESQLLDEKKKPVCVPIDARGQAHWDWPALSAAFHALVRTKDRAARIDQAQFKLFMSLKHFRDQVEQHPTRAVGPRQLQLALQDMVELLDSFGDVAGADRVKGIPLDL